MWQYVLGRMEILVVAYQDTHIFCGMQIIGGVRQRVLNLTQ